MRASCVYIFVVIPALFLSCKKKDDKKVEEPAVKITTDLKAGLPKNATAINGYFYANIKNHIYQANKYALNAYAVLNDPAQDLINSFDHASDSHTGSGGHGNVNVGAVFFNDLLLTSSNNDFFNPGISENISYDTTTAYTTSPTPKRAVWKTDGNGSFKAIDIEVTRGFPVIKVTEILSSQTPSLSIHNGYTVNIGDYISNYDSLIISIGPGFGSTIKKSVAPGTSSVYFSNNDLSILVGNADVTLNYFAYNYSNKIIENVTYVFELSNKYKIFLSVNP